MFLLVPLTDDRRRRFERIFRGALRDIDFSRDRGAQEADADTRYFARQLSGEVGTLNALTKQTDDYWQAVGERLIVEFGISRRARLAAKLRKLTIGRTRQLRIRARRDERQVS